jgi:uncharacterized protein
MSNPGKQNTINYIELPCTNSAAIQKFYSSVFGWSFQEWGPDYLSFNDGNAEGGFNRELKVSVDGPLVILYAKDLEVTVQAVKKNGGTIKQEIFAFPGGRRFHFTDPDGNVLAVWSE